MNIVAHNPVDTTPRALAMHHDLWIELARIEMSMETLDDQTSVDSASQRQRLEQRRSQLSHAMQCLSE